MKKHENSMKKDKKINGFWWSNTIETYWKTNAFIYFWPFRKTMKKLWFLIEISTSKSPRLDLSYDFWKRLCNLQPDLALPVPDFFYSLFFLLLSDSFWSYSDEFCSLLINYLSFKGLSRTGLILLNGLTGITLKD